ncbi:MAG: type IV secretory system conjugative DNA transfer family protein [Chloroflexota bacterium]|nr:type IV secretory system conjugative DNA transfer family protein [Chloroflexota bacterium]
MFLRIERPAGAPSGNAGTVGPPAQLFEIVSPRTNAASYTPIEHLFAALAREGGVSLELGADASARRFFARVSGPHTQGLLEAQLGAAYPQARLRPAVGDPARLLPGEQVAATRLGLREPEYLPLRILRDSELIAERAPQADPLLGVLAALGSMPPGWRALAQLVLQPAPRDWARRHLRRSLEHALEPERAERLQSSRIGSVGWGGVVVAAAFLAAVIVLPRLWALYMAHGWLPLVLLGVPATIGLLGLYALWLRLVDRPLYDLELVKEKLSRPAARAELRLVVFAPTDVTPAEVQARLEHVAAAYHAYDLERGNGLVARSLALPDAADALCAPVPVGSLRQLATLTTRELAGLWHLVQAADDVALIERTTARRFLPLPETVADGARIGVAEDGVGHAVAVHVGPTLLRRHALLVAKTRKGKSALLSRLWQQLVDLPETAGQLAPTVVLVDPHSDLASIALGLVPAARHSQVVHLDVGQAVRRPFGLNLLDVGLGWGRDQLVENALRVFKHEFDRFWGPRMELVFRMALVLLVDANQRLVAADPSGGRSRQYTILEVPRVLEDDVFRGQLLLNLLDPQMQALWRTFFKPLDHRFKLEVINPVQTKVYKFAANQAARAIVGQSRSTIDPLAWVRDGAVVVVDGAKERVGADIAALIGGTLLNQVALAVGQQAVLPPARRRHVAVLVDEFHALPAADYEAFLAELGKYGASLVLATQSLGMLDAIDADRGLRHTVFANVDHLYAFNCSAEDARALAPELGGRIELADLVELGDHQCYARLSHHGERLPAFHLRLDPPPEADPSVAEVLAACSAAQYGRDAAVVAADRAAVLERLDGPVSVEGHGRANTDPEGGRIPPASAGTVAPPRSGARRNEQRPTGPAPERHAGPVRIDAAPRSELGLRHSPLNAPAQETWNGGDGGAGHLPPQLELQLDVADLAAPDGGEDDGAAGGVT